MEKTRAAAVESGDKRYFTGIPCKKGHYSERYTSTGGCILCGIEQARKWYESNKDKAREKHREYSKAWRERKIATDPEFMEKQRAHGRKYAAKNREREAKRSSDYYKNNKEECLRKMRERYRENRDRYLEQGRKYYHRTKEMKKEQRRAYREANADMIREQKRRWSQKNRDYVLGEKKRHYEENKELYYRAGRKRRSIQLMAYVPFDPELLEIVEKEAEDKRLKMEKITGVKHHIDHIVPLNSPIVCGLHAWTNLQVISYRENIGKGNRYWPDMP